MRITGVPKIVCKKCFHLGNEETAKVDRNPSGSQRYLCRAYWWHRILEPVRVDPSSMLPSSLQPRVEGLSHAGVGYG